MASKKQTKSKNTRPRMMLKVFITIATLIVVLLVTIASIDWIWNINYHKDDLRDRPINKNFVYIGRDLRDPNALWELNVIGLGGLTGPANETLYYATNIPPNNFANELPGNWQQKENHISGGCNVPVNDNNCVDLDVRNEQSKGGDISYVSRQALLNASKTIGFPLKTDKRKYYVGISDYAMEYINPKNVDPEVHKSLLGNQASTPN